jgi:hypothetical protein
VPFALEMTFDQSFALCAGAMAILCFMGIQMVREPNPRPIEEGKEEQSFTEMCSELTGKVKGYVFTDIKWIFCFVAASEA